MKKCAIYARSTPDQGVDDQLCGLRQFAKQQDFEVLFEYQDVAVSDRKSRRRGLDAMLIDARNERYNVVIVAAFDRIAHSTKQLVSVVAELDDLGVEFVSRRENIATCSATGQLFLTFIRSIAELEANLVRERIRAGMRRRRQDGLHVGRRPLEVDRQSMVRDRLGGMSLRDVARKYSVSRPSIVRWVRQARQATAMPVSCVLISPARGDEHAA